MRVLFLFFSILDNRGITLILFDSFSTHLAIVATSRYFSHWTGHQNGALTVHTREAQNLVRVTYTPGFVGSP